MIQFIEERLMLPIVLTALGMLIAELHIASGAGLVVGAIGVAHLAAKETLAWVRRQPQSKKDGGAA